MNLPAARQAGQPAVLPRDVAIAPRPRSCTAAAGACHLVFARQAGAVQALATSRCDPFLEGPPSPTPRGAFLSRSTAALRVLARCFAPPHPQAPLPALATSKGGVCLEDAECSLSTLKASALGANGPRPSSDAREPGYFQSNTWRTFHYHEGLGQRPPARWSSFGAPNMRGAPRQGLSPSAFFRPSSRARGRG